MNFRFLFLVLISFSILFVSCEADINLQNISEEVSLHPDLIVPIGSANVNLGQIIMHNDPTGKFEPGNDFEINYISFDSVYFKIPNLNLLDISTPLKRNLYPSTSILTVLSPNSALPPLNYNDTIKLGINSTKNGDRIDSINVKSAVISVIIDISPDLSSIRPSDLIYTIHFPKGKIRMLDGSSGSISFTPFGFGVVKNISLLNFMLSTIGGENGIPVNITVMAKSGSTPLLLNQLSAISSTIRITQLDYSVAYGNFKSILNLNNIFQQSIDFDEDLPNGLIRFANPQVCISASSNLGTFLNFRINYIKSFLSTNQNLKAVYADFNGDRYTNIQINKKPSIPGDTINIKLGTLNKEWGGTSQLFENETDNINMPDKLQYNFSASVDSVLNNQSKTPAFITSNASIKVKMKTIIPLNFTKGSYYEFKDSIPNVFALIANALNQFPYNNITSTALILNITNGLPVKTVFSFALNDSLGKQLPVTFEKNYVIESGKTDANGLVLPGKETKQTIEVKVDKDQLVILRKARSITYIVRVEGDNINSNIHFTTINKFDLKVGLFVKGDVNTTIGTVN